ALTRNIYIKLRANSTRTVIVAPAHSPDQEKSVTLSNRGTHDSDTNSADGIMTQQGITIARRLTRTIGPLTCAVTLLVSTAGWATGTTTRPPRTSIEDGSTADHALGSQIRRHE